MPNAEIVGNNRTRTCDLPPGQGRRSFQLSYIPIDKKSEL